MEEREEKTEEIKKAQIRAQYDTVSVCVCVCVCVFVGVCVCGCVVETWTDSHRV